MKKILKKITIASFVTTSLLSTSLFAEAKYSLLASGGQGYCKSEQMGNKIEARIRVVNITASSIATSWVKLFNAQDEKVGEFQLDNSVADKSGDVTFKGDFEVTEDVVKYTLTVKDHESILTDITDDEILSEELAIPTNPLTGTSVTTGKCAFDIVK